MSQVHRFGESVALSLGNGTVYLNVAHAREIATALQECADDIESVGFADSDFATLILDMEELS